MIFERYNKFLSDCEIQFSLNPICYQLLKESIKFEFIEQKFNQIQFEVLYKNLIPCTLQQIFGNFLQSHQQINLNLENALLKASNEENRQLQENVKKNLELSNENYVQLI